MEQRLLGRTGIRVSVLGLGTGGANLFGQAGGATLAEARTLVRRALDLGVTFFDTAAAYRDSEDRLGGALAGVARDRYVLASKVQPRSPSGELLGAEDVAAALRRSLVRLRTDVIDLYQVHALAAADHDAVIEHQLPELLRARDAGLIRAIGVTESFAGDDPGHATLGRVVAEGIFDTVMVGYNVLHQTAERQVLPVAAAAGIGVIVMAAVRRALASRDALERLIAELKADGSLAPDSLADTDPLGWLIHDDTPSVQAACYRFVAGHPAVSTVLTGTFDADHLAQNAAAVAQGGLSGPDADRLRALFGHLDRGLGR